MANWVLDRRLSILIAATVSVTLGAAALAVSEIQQDRPVVLKLLDRYDRGDQDGAVAEFRNAQDPAGLARDLDRYSEAWAAPPGSTADTVERRQLVAAVFTLEVASLRRDTWELLRYRRSKKHARGCVRAGRRLLNMCGTWRLSRSHQARRTRTSFLASHARRLIRWRPADSDTLRTPTTRADVSRAKQGFVLPKLLWLIFQVSSSPIGMRRW